MQNKRTVMLALTLLNFAKKMLLYQLLDEQMCLITRSSALRLHKSTRNELYYWKKGRNL
jgi:hypothetical protein